MLAACTVALALSILSQPTDAAPRPLGNGEDSAVRADSETPSPATSSPQDAPQPTLAVVSAVGPAEPHHFSRPRDIYIAGTTNALIGGSHVSAGGDTTNDFTFGLGGDLGFFIGRHFALGTRLLLDATAGGGVDRVNFAFGPLLAGRFSLHESSHLLPSLGVLYNATLFQAGQRKQVGNYLLFDISLPFVFELGTGIAIHVGPFIAPGIGALAVDRSSGTATEIRYGLRAGLLGWL